jgi:Fe-S-cluster containining protein
MPSNEDARRWFTYHGLIVRDLNEEQMAIFGHANCEMLLRNADGTTSCAVYSTRPEICKVFLCKDARSESVEESKELAS